MHLSVKAECTNWCYVFKNHSNNKNKLTGQICLQRWWDPPPPHNQSSCADNLSDRWQLVWKEVQEKELHDMNMIKWKYTDGGNDQQQRYAVKSSSREQHTCNVNWSPHEAVVIEETGGPLSQQYLHTAGIPFLGSQVQHRTACSILHIHIGCSLRQHTQRLPVALISLREPGGGRQLQQLCVYSTLKKVDYNQRPPRERIKWETLTARCSGLTGILLSMSPSALKDISRS